MTAWLSKSFKYLLQFILLLIFVLPSKNSSLLALTNETDQQALLAIKDLITEDPLNVLRSWNTSLHFCQWIGVICGRSHQRVTSLNLSALHLVGTLSPHIGNLTFLRKIYLYNNSFHGTIPQEIGGLFRLRILVLHTNFFEGDFPSNLTCLDIISINIHNNKIGGNILGELGRLSSLEHLALQNNMISGSIPPSFGNLSSLLTLSMAFNKLVGSIPWEFSLLSKLQHLCLTMNNLQGMVPLSLYNISSLYYLELSQNLLQGKLPSNLGLKLPNLKSLILSSNKFTGVVPPSIVNASSLVDMEIDSNSFVGPLSMNFGSLRNLTNLLFSQNKFGINSPPNYLNILVKSLINCTNLNMLAAGSNGFGGELPHSIANLSRTLSILGLGANNLRGSIPQEFGNLKGNLRWLVLSENKLAGSMPESIGELSQLENLYISSSNISGEVPASIGNISRLSILDFGNNMLQGKLPITLGNLTNLLKLYLNDNRFSGEVPDTIFGVSSAILYLSLEKNQLTGRLPVSIGSLQNLGHLRISGNRLTGEIPSALGNCLMMETLYMDNNFFQGTLPSSFKQLSSIRVMDLSYNNLSGQLPSFLAEFKYFEHLNLSHNNFKGDVPTKGVFLDASMLTLDGNPQLCGGIQALKLPACHTSKSFPHKLIIPFVVILPVVILLLCVVMTLSLFRRSKKQNPSSPSLQDQHLQLSYGELLQATNVFSLTNLIGEGRYGSVYKGILSSASDQIVAVKVVNVELQGATKGFLAECEIFRNIRHRNLVKIITSCSGVDFQGSDFKALVLEYMTNGSLDSWLHPDSTSEQHKRTNLTLLQRMNIAIDVASAVDYLHNHCPTKIVHCDLKPSNILLDEDLNARVSDFGLAKFLSDDATSKSSWSEASSIGIRGTTGYVPPEYGMGAEVSAAGDVYSYGIVLLELFVGKRPTDIMFADVAGIRNWACEALAKRWSEDVDSCMTMEGKDGRMSEIEEACLSSVLQIGISCSADRPTERMDIAIVVKELLRLRNVLTRV